MSEYNPRGAHHAASERGLTRPEDSGRLEYCNRGSSRPKHGDVAVVNRQLVLKTGRVIQAEEPSTWPRCT
jgi:hypothetical protein